jgi:hypothetical protein
LFLEEMKKRGVSMKILRRLAFIFILSLLPAYAHSQNLGDLRISLIDGDVQIRTEDTGDWVPASINMPLRDGDRIWVPEGGKTELQLRDGSYLRLNEKSALEILTLDKDSFQFYLTEGHAYTNFKGRRGSLLQMDTPISSIRAYDRSIFRMGIADDGLTQVSVFRGTVDAESKSGRTTIRSGYTLILKEETYAELSPLGPPDKWERWNSERDRTLAERRPPSRYLPEELYAYSSDFEENGRWVYASEFGYVWAPRVVVSVGWAPYRMGRWVWIAGDYVWISYEPWGWVPYHYGRWAFIASSGWCWVPPARGAVFWGPGFVAWVRTPTHVAWVPLAPREIYYGRGHYGPHSVNITNVNITNIQVNQTTYKNIHVQNAVTVVHQDTFVKGKHVDVKVKENPFLKEKISVGRPDIKPEKATHMPVIKEIPQTKRPPEPIREIRVKELKEKRPLVKERNASVLRPESPPKEMTLKVKEGKPVERKVEQTRGPRPTEKGVEKPRESKPLDRKIEKPSSVEKGKEKPQESKPPERGGDKTKESKPSEKGIEKPRSMEKEIAKPKEARPPEKGAEKGKESKPSERAIEKPRETKPPERGVEKPGESLSQGGRGMEKPKEPKPIEKGIERPKDLKPPGKGIEKPQESRPPERGTEKSRPLEKGIEKGRSVEKGLESRPPERGVEKPRELKPSEGGVGKPRDTVPLERGVERQKELPQPERGMENPQELRPPERGIERSKPPEMEKERPRSMERRHEGPKEFRQGGQRGGRSET